MGVSVIHGGLGLVVTNLPCVRGRPRAYWAVGTLWIDTSNTK